MSWTETTLGEVVTLKRGHDLPESQRRDGSIPIVSSSGVTGFHNIAKAEPPGVVTGRYGTIGEVFYIQEPYWPLNTALYAINFHGNDPKFVSYFLRNSLKGTTGSKAAVPGVNRNDLHAYRVRVPDLAAQVSIANKLSVYDDLIDNNKRRIKLLEEAARLTYRGWFVRFRFPGHELTKIQNGLPEGWHRAAITDLAEFLSRGISPAYDDDVQGLVINQKCVRDGLLDLGPARHQSKKVPASKFVRVGDVLVNSTGAGTLGRVAQVLEEIPDCTVDSHVTIVRPRENLSPAWFGMALVSMQSVIEGMGKGATNQTELSKTDLGELKLTVPSKSVSDEFDQLVSPLRRQVQVLRNQCKALQKARDLLLPRLISGEIDV